MDDVGIALSDSCATLHAGPVLSCESSDAPSSPYVRERVSGSDCGLLRKGCAADAAVKVFSCLRYSSDLVLEGWTSSDVHSRVDVGGSSVDVDEGEIVSAIAFCSCTNFAAMRTRLRSCF